MESQAAQLRYLLLDMRVAPRTPVRQPTLTDAKAHDEIRGSLSWRVARDAAHANQNAVLSRAAHFAYSPASVSVQVVHAIIASAFGFAPPWYRSRGAHTWVVKTG